METGWLSKLLNLRRLKLTFIKVSVVAFQDRESGMWFAQGLQYDIAVQARTPDDLWPAFHDAFMANVQISVDLGRKPLEGIEPAPQEYWEMFRMSKSRIWRRDTPTIRRLIHRRPEFRLATPAAA